MLRNMTDAQLEDRLRSSGKPPMKKGNAMNTRTKTLANQRADQLFSAAYESDENAKRMEDRLRVHDDLVETCYVDDVGLYVVTALLTDRLARLHRLSPAQRKREPRTVALSRGFLPAFASDLPLSTPSTPDVISPQSTRGINVERRKELNHLLRAARDLDCILSDTVAECSAEQFTELLGYQSTLQKRLNEVGVRFESLVNQRVAHLDGFEHLYENFQPTTTTT